MLNRPTPGAPDWEHVVSLFGIDGPVFSADSVIGGWSHNVWRVGTAAGEFAIKELADNPQPWWASQMKGAIDFELRAWRSGGIPMAEPVPDATGNYLPLVEADGGRRRYRCHRWVAGRRCLDEPPSVERSRHVGAIVAKLVGLGVAAGSTSEHLAWNALDAYEETVAEAEAKGLDWAPLVAGLRGGVAELRAQFADLVDRALPMLVLHRDFDPKNAARAEGGEVAVFDWDSAGPSLPAGELLATALAFAGGPLQADESCVRATLDAYAAAGGPPADFRGAAAPIAEEGFRWLLLNAWRALGHREATSAQSAFSASLVRSLAPAWPDVRASLERWEAALASGST